MITKISSAIPVDEKAKGLLFDCDGTLADTMKFHTDAWCETFSALGITCPEVFLEPLKGMKEKNIIELYNEKFKTDLDCRKFLEDKHSRFRKKLEDVKPIDVVVAIVRNYYGRLPMAVVSGGTRDNVLLTLDAVGLNGLFDVILTADDPIPPKPAPDIMIEAARLIAVQPHECQVFEDGDAGLEAARSAGMIAVDVRPFL